MATEQIKCWNKQVIRAETPSSGKKNDAWHLHIMQPSSPVIHQLWGRDVTLFIYITQQELECQIIHSRWQSSLHHSLVFSTNSHSAAPKTNYQQQLSPSNSIVLVSSGSKFEKSLSWARTLKVIEVGKGNFRPVSHSVFEMGQDRVKVTIHHHQEVTYSLSIGINSMTLDDAEWP